MLAICPLPTEPTPVDESPAPAGVMLANGRMTSLAGLSAAALRELQWEQEQKFAEAIPAFLARSPERAMIIGQAYDTISTILAHLEVAESQAASAADAPLVMGFAPKYAKLVLKLLKRQEACGELQPRLFEIGYGSGVLLKEVREFGFEVGGIEISAVMGQRARRLLGPRHGEGLLVGEFLKLQPSDLPGPPTLIYWNDVLEHVPVDEAADYLAHIRGLLAPQGQLVTITPNWLLRPSDVTCEFCPPRTTARGLHLKEYRLSEVARLLKRAGFRRVSTPVAVTRSRVLMCGGGGRMVKQLIEPLVDWLPVSTARLLCRGFGMSCTIASK